MWRNFIAAIRLIRLLALFASGLLQLGLYRLWWGKHWYYGARGGRVIQRWMQRCCRILGLQIQVSGNVNPQPQLLVANHISWIDIVAISATTPVSFVSKTDLQGWPIVGTLASQSGTVFIQRGKASSLTHILQRLAQIINAGRSVVFFPEGTTTDGSSVGKFYSGLFQLAYQCGCPVQPLALRYQRGGQRDDLAPYIDDDHFVTHLLAILAAPGTELYLEFLPLVHPEALSRQQMAQLCREQILQALQNPLIDIVDEAEVEVVSLSS